MATFNTGNIYGSRSMTLNITEENININNNTSDVRWELRVQGDSTFYDTGVLIQINDTTVYSREVSWSGGFPAQPGSVSGTVKNIKHNDSDGSKTINVVFNAYVYNYSYNSYGGNVELTKIPRASDIAVPNTNLGQNIPITIGKKVDSYTSTLVYEIGSLSGTIVSKTSLSSYPWILSTDLITQIKNAYPNTKNVLAKIKCKTYSGNTQIGNETEATFYLYIVDKPTISNVVRTELNTNISSKTTAVLKSVSQNRFTITATAPVGTTIKGYRVKNGNQDSGLSTSNVVNLNDIQSSYKVNSSLKTKFIIKAIDNRDNESDEYEVVCDFIDYINVSINKTDTIIKRTNTTSDDCIIYLTGNFYNSNIGASSNAITAKYRFKKQGTSSYSEWKPITTTSSGNKFVINNVKITDKFDYMYNYDFEFLIKDSVNSSDDYLKTFVNSVPFVKYHKKGAWIKELDTDRLDAIAITDNFLGLIIESGNNENGNWVKFADGTMICFGKSTTDTLSWSQDANIWQCMNLELPDFPQEFIGPPIVTKSIQNMNISARNIWITGNSEPTNTNPGTYNLATYWNATGTTVTVSYIAIGRWK